LIKLQTFFGRSRSSLNGAFAALDFESRHRRFTPEEKAFLGRDHCTWTVRTLRKEREAPRIDEGTDFADSGWDPAEDRGFLVDSETLD
jgi:hypothetical protein